MLAIIDKKGDLWELICVGQWTRSRKGLCEGKFVVATSPPSESGGYYHIIPLPCFTEWWESSDVCQ